jgi:anti-sigma-K factor RskA
MNIDAIDNEGEDLSAAEFVLGLLDADARREAESRLQRDAAFAAEVAQWQTRLAPWLQAIAPVVPPQELWSRIRTNLWSHELPQRTRVEPTRASRALAMWRGLAITGLTAAAASLAMLAFVLRQPPPSAPPPIVVTQPPLPVGAPMSVVLRQDNGSVAYTATLAVDGTLVVTPVQVATDARAPELWLIPPGDKPHSLGMLQRDHPMAVRVPAGLLAVARDGLFAVSLEPAGSGPHEAPTGPVVAKGSVVTL